MLPLCRCFAHPFRAPLDEIMFFFRYASVLWAFSCFSAQLIFPNIYQEVVQSGVPVASPEDSPKCLTSHPDPLFLAPGGSKHRECFEFVSQITFGAPRIANKRAPAARIQLKLDQACQENRNKARSISCCPTATKNVRALPEC